MHEDRIVEAVQKAVEERLLGCNASRTYFTQALLPGVALPVSSELVGREGEKREADKHKEPTTYAYQMVRTDAKEQKLDAFFVPKSLKEKQLPPSTEIIEGAVSASGGEGKVEVDEGESMEVEEEGNSATAVSSKKRTASPLEQPFKRKVRRKEVKLTSVKSLQQAVRTRMHKGNGEHVCIAVIVGWLSW